MESADGARDTGSHLPVGQTNQTPEADVRDWLPADPRRLRLSGGRSGVLIWPKKGSGESPLNRSFQGRLYARLPRLVLHELRACADSLRGGSRCDGGGRRRRMGNRAEFEPHRPDRASRGGTRPDAIGYGLDVDAPLQQAVGEIPRHYPANPQTPEGFSRCGTRARQHTPAQVDPV